MRLRRSGVAARSGAWLEGIGRVVGTDLWVTADGRVPAVKVSWVGRGIPGPAFAHHFPEMAYHGRAGRGAGSFSMPGQYCE